MKKKIVKTVKSVKIKKEKPKLINLKVQKHELGLIMARAEKYAGGNLSLWLRHAGTKYTPR